MAKSWLGPCVKYGFIFYPIQTNQEKDSKVLGDLQKGAIDVQGCSIGKQAAV